MLLEHWAYGDAQASLFPGLIMEFLILILMVWLG